MPFKYLVAIDFEATCFMTNQNDNQKIIEFGAAAVSLESGQILHEFQKFVRQDVVLTQRCSEFTGVRQANISNAKSFDRVLNQFDSWLRKHKVYPRVKKHNTAIVTWSDNDLKVLLPPNCAQVEFGRPRNFKKWIDLTKYAVSGNTSLEKALSDYGLAFVGEPHRALNDAKNTARLGYEINKRCTLDITSLNTKKSTIYPMFFENETKSINK